MACNCLLAGGETQKKNKSSPHLLRFRENYCSNPEKEVKYYRARTTILSVLSLGYGNHPVKVEQSKSSSCAPFFNKKQHSVGRLTIKEVKEMHFQQFWR